MTVYVDPLAACTGNYSFAGRNCSGSSGDSYTTIAAAQAAIGTSAGAGANDIIIVRTGTYTAAITAQNSGTSWDAPFTLMGAPGENPIIRAAGSQNVGFQGSIDYWTIFAGFVLDGTNIIDQQIMFGGGTAWGSRVKVQNVEVINTEVAIGIFIGRHSQNVEILTSKLHGGAYTCPPGTCGGGGAFTYPLYIEGSNNTIEGNEIYNTPSYCIHIYSGWPEKPTNNVVRNNKLHDCSQLQASSAAILLGASINNVAYNNLVYGNFGHGIAVGNGSSGAKIYSNTVYNNAESGLGVGTQSSTEFKNNVSVNNGGGNFSVGGTAPTFANNLCDVPGTGCATVANPLFADAANGDFRLCTGSAAPHASCSGASPAIDIGAALGAPYNIDFTGTARPQGAGWDVGAYEASAAPPGPACPQTPALVAAYSFDGVATDSSGNGNNATLGLGLTYAAGKYGQGVQMNGTAGITVPRSTSLFLCTGLTISLSVQLPSTLSNFRALVASNYGSTYDGFFLYAGSTSYAQAGAPIGGYCIGNCATKAVAVYGTNLTTSRTDIALTWDNSLGSANLKLWINGVNVTSATGTATLADWAGNLCIGCSPFGEYLPSGAVVDEVRIYNYARTEAQIKSDMSTPIGSPTTMITIKIGPSITKKIGPSITEKIGLVP